MKKNLTLLFLAALVPLGPLHGEAVAWFSEKFPVDEEDLASLRPDDPHLKKLIAYKDAAGGLAILAPIYAPNSQVDVTGEPALREGKQLVLSLNSFLATPEPGWKSVFVGLTNSSGHRMGVIFDPRGFYPARFTPEFRGFAPVKPCSFPAELRFRREDGRLTIVLDGTEILSVEQPEGAPYEIPVILAARQSPENGVLGVFSPAVIE